MNQSQLKKWVYYVSVKEVDPCITFAKRADIHYELLKAQCLITKELTTFGIVFSTENESQEMWLQLYCNNHFLARF